MPEQYRYLMVLPEGILETIKHSLSVTAHMPETYFAYKDYLLDIIDDIESQQETQKGLKGVYNAMANDDQ